MKRTSPWQPSPNETPRRRGTPSADNVFACLFDASQVRVGDEVVLERAGQMPKLVKVIRKTDKRIWIEGMQFLEEGRQFLADGTECYGGGGHLIVPTIEELEALRAQAQREEFKQLFGDPDTMAKDLLREMIEDDKFLG